MSRQQDRRHARDHGREGRTGEVSILADDTAQRRVENLGRILWTAEAAQP
jgi:hypothetical protein